jgi:tRNA nucleotidyltransferase (CCA-adding enzyme)
MKHPREQTVLLNRIPARLRYLLKHVGRLADEQGVSVFLVGGVVRDLLLKRENFDLDLAIEGNGIAFARLVADQYRAGLAIFERFATARLVFPDGLKVDIATTRQESYARPALLPTVQPAPIQADLFRRDFTINAIAVQLNSQQWGRVFDPFAGQQDLRSHTIRVLHAGSFQDDPTRIFRAIRFEQRFRFRLTRTTSRLLAQAASRNLIERLSGPRLQNEILLLLAERDPVRVIARLAQLKLLRFLHPRLCYTKNVKRMVTAVPKAIGWWTRRFPDSAIDRPIVYLMGLLSDSSQAVVAGVIRRLAFSREQAKKVSDGGHRVDHVLKRLTDNRAAKPSQVYHLLEALSHEVLVLLLAKQQGMQCGAQSLVKRRIAEYMKGKVIKTALTGWDLQTMGLKPGPLYKTILGKLLNARIDGVIKTEADERALAHKLLLLKDRLVVREE